MKFKCTATYGSGSYFTVGKTLDVVSYEDGCHNIIDDTGHEIYTRTPGLLHGKFEVGE